MRQNATVDFRQKCVYLINGDRVMVHCEYSDYPKKHRPKQKETIHAFGKALSEDRTAMPKRSIKYSIRLTNPTPFQIRPYQFSPGKQHVVNKQIKKVLTTESIEPSTSIYTSPVTLVNIVTRRFFSSTIVV